MSRTALACVVAIAALSAACATTQYAGPTPHPFPGSSPGARPRPPVEARPGEPADAGVVGAGEAGEGNAALFISPEAYALVTTALELRGTPYVNGGSDPFGFDCSGFTQWVFAQNHVALPREVKDQYRIGDKVKVDELTAGDLLFFATTSREASHVGIALGPDEFIHAPSSNGVVRVERLSTKYWAERYLGARRIGLR